MGQFVTVAELIEFLKDAPKDAMIAVETKDDLLGCIKVEKKSDKVILRVEEN
jgi:hypothetical protein